LLELCGKIISIKGKGNQKQISPMWFQIKLMQKMY